MPDPFTVDTIQVRPASDAFPGSVLLAPSEPGGTLAHVVSDWGDSPVNGILIVAFTLLTVLYLRRLVGILPYLTKGLWRWKEILNLEASMRLSRDRSAFALVMVVPFCLVVSRFDLFPVRWPDLPDPGYKTLLIVGVFAVYALLRRFAARLAMPRRISHDTYRIASNCGYNFFIVMTLLMVATAGICSVAGVENDLIRKILLYEMAVVFTLFMIRRTQILSNACNQFTAFLYLCGLEILPAGLLVASALIF